MSKLLRILLYIVGVYLISISILFMIIYLNLFIMGYTFINYVYFIIRRVEVLSIIPGIILVTLSFRKDKNK